MEDLHKRRKKEGEDLKKQATYTAEELNKKHEAIKQDEEKKKKKKKKLTAAQMKRMELDQKPVHDDVKKDEKLKSVEAIFGENDNLKYAKFNQYISRNQAVPKCTRTFRNDRSVQTG